jgi:hypothetical protein
MAKSRYFPTRTLRSPRDPSDPRHYATWDLPATLKGYASVNLLQGQQQTYQHVFQAGDRVDKLSQKYFGDDDYGWLICLVNNVQYPLGIAPGTVLYIPGDVDTVLELLNMV